MIQYGAFILTQRYVKIILKRLIAQNIEGGYTAQNAVFVEVFRLYNICVKKL